MTRSTQLNTGAICIAILGAAALLGRAGPLNPPAGPVLDTGRFGTRTEINLDNTPGDSSSTFRIAQPGSYFIAGNLTGEVSKHGITIAASDVTLDLNGFVLQGVAGSLNGVFTEGIQSNISIFNGTVTDWSAEGIDVINGLNCQLSRVRASDNANDGLRIGDNGLVIACSVEGNGADGVRASDGCTIVHCNARGNTANGFSVQFQSTVKDCTSTENGQRGITGGLGCAMLDCTAYANGDDGIRASTGSSITGCTAVVNLGDGIEAVTGGTVSGNTCRSNGVGIHVTSIYNRIEGNHITGNTTGLLVDSIRNYIADNTVRTNADNYNIAQVNHVNILLSEIPETIDWPANVTLAGSLVGGTGIAGIIVNADDVTIDMAGHSLIGVANSLDGIEINADFTCVRNGTIRDWGLDGIDSSDGGRGAQFEDLRAINNGGHGLQAGSDSTVLNCVAFGNGSTGILTGADSVIRGCAGNDNSTGIDGNVGSIVTGCAAHDNTILGIRSTAGTISQCVADFNGTNGLQASQGLVHASSAGGNGGSDIAAGTSVDNN